LIVLKIFVSFFFENMTIINYFFSWQSFSFCKKQLIRLKMLIVAKMLIIYFVAFCLEMWNVIEKCDFRFFLAKTFLWIRFRDHAWSSHRLCFDCSTRIFSKWRTRFNSIFRDDKSLTRSLIKFDESDSSNLTKAIH
jgi:hypothetical protein